MSRRRTLRSRRWLVGLVAMVPVGTLLAMFVMVSPASADTGPMFITFGQGSFGQSYCLDDWLDNQDPYGSSLVDVYPCNGTVAQLFTYGNGNVYPNTIELAYYQEFTPYLCLDVAGGGTADGTPVRMYYCNGTPAQTWVPDTSQTGGPAQLVNPQSGKCLDDPDGALTPPGGPPVQLQIWDCISNDTNQMWSSSAW
jgi:Ricin-type beta-trefoil lectin domain